MCGNLLLTLMVRSPSPDLILVLSSAEPVFHHKDLRRRRVEHDSFHHNPSPLCFENRPKKCERLNFDTHLNELVSKVMLLQGLNGDMVTMVIAGASSLLLNLLS